MALHTASDLSAAEFREALGVLGQHRIARLFSVSPRHVRRWRDGTRHVPRAVGIVIHLLSVGVITADQIEQAAAAIPAPVQANGGAQPAPILTEPAEAIALADPSLSTAQKILGLVEGTCRWPIGDPGHPSFCFCGRATVREPYCEQHRAAAHVAQRELIGPRPTPQ